MVGIQPIDSQFDRHARNVVLIVRWLEMSESILHEDCQGAWTLLTLMGDLRPPLEGWLKPKYVPDSQPASSAARSELSAGFASTARGIRMSLDAEYPDANVSLAVGGLPPHRIPELDFLRKSVAA